MRDYKSYGFTDAETRLLEFLESIEPSQWFVEPFFVYALADGDLDGFRERLQEAIRVTGITDPNELLKAMFMPDDEDDYGEEEEDEDEDGASE